MTWIMSPPPKVSPHTSALTLPRADIKSPSTCRALVSIAAPSVVALSLLCPRTQSYTTIERFSRFPLLKNHSARQIIRTTAASFPPSLFLGVFLLSTPRCLDSVHLVNHRRYPGSAETTSHPCQTSVVVVAQCFALQATWLCCNY